jgi:magnesium chelatase subunit H
MTRKPTSAAERPASVTLAAPLEAAAAGATLWPLARRAASRSAAAAAVPVRVVIVTMDTHMASALQRARRQLLADYPRLELSVHAASDFADDAAALQTCRAAIAEADIIVAGMLFLEDHFLPILDALRARRPHCDALIGMVSASEVVKLTRLGQFDMDKPASGPMALLQRLRGNRDKTSSGGAAQMKMLRRIPQLLRFIPGTAQDVRAYFLAMQYWLGGSQANMLNLVRHVIDRGADGPRRMLRGRVRVDAPLVYPEVGVYHPRMVPRMAESTDALPRSAGARGRVGLLLLRSYLLADNCAHYDGVIAALEARGLQVLPVFASGLDARPAIERHFFDAQGRPTIDALVSLTGFSLVGGPAYNDAKAAEAVLARLDVPYLAAHPVEFQTLGQWGASERGLMPVESTIMVAIPELDGATAPMVFGGRPGEAGSLCRGCARGCRFGAAGQAAADMLPCPERAEALAARVARLVALRRKPTAERQVAIVLFAFPPNAGTIGTAAHLSVFESLHNLLAAMRARGYDVQLPADAEALRVALLEGNAKRHGTDANVLTLIPTDDHVRREPWLAEIEAQWGPAPGRQLSNGRGIFVLGARFGRVLVAIQPGFGYEGDPMRLMFERGLAPTHAFSAFYRHVRDDFGADAVLHFGTHGALEFMPGKQTGLSGNCWPERLIGDLPHFYLYAANNPSEGALAKRRAAATLVSYLTPPITQAGLYQDLQALKSAIDRFRGLEPGAAERAELAAGIQQQAAALDLCAATPPWPADDALDDQVYALDAALLGLHDTLIPHGLHVVGRAADAAQRRDMLAAVAQAETGRPLAPAALDALLSARAPRQLAAQHRDSLPPELAERLVALDSALAADTEIEALLAALDARYLRPSPSGDLLRSPDILPTGRNLHGFDPFRMPSAFAVKDGARLAERLLDAHQAGGQPLPESIAMVLWGSDNLKSEGAPIAQALALMGALPRFDSYGRVAGATLVPLEQLGRPRIDVVITLSGIFRDLLPLQIRMLADAAFQAASAEHEPLERNWIRKHALAYQREHGCTLEVAALRVFGNGEGAYGANVNHLIEHGGWDDEAQIARTFTRRKGFAYGRNGRAQQQTALLGSALADVQLTYQNLESLELGVTTVDNYFDTLGGITHAVKHARGGAAPPVYIGDSTRGDGVVRSLREQVALEARTRLLNPKWAEGLLAHGYEGVRQIEAHVTNTLGWSATTGQVQPWVYRQLTQTYMLDPAMRERLARLNPTASARVANRLLEACARDYWQPDAQTLDALRRAGEELEDRLEGIGEGAPA